MTSLSDSLYRIPTTDHAAAFGTYCMSGEANDNSNILEQWFAVDNKETLLSKCSALLCRDSVGRLIILSAPRLANDDRSKTKNNNKVILAHQGNSLRYLDPVSVPIEAIYKNVIGFMPQPLPIAMKGTFITVANKAITGQMRIPVYDTGGTCLASIPAVLPLAYGHQVDEDMAHGSIRAILAACHPYYADWIDTTGNMYQRYMGKSLHEKIAMKLPGKGREHLASSILVSPTHPKQDSSLCKELCSDLNLIRAGNLKAWLESPPSHRDAATEQTTSTPQLTTTFCPLPDISANDAASMTLNEKATIKALEEKTAIELAVAPSEAAAKPVAEMLSPSFPQVQSASFPPVQAPSSFPPMPPIELTHSKHEMALLPQPWLEEPLVPMQPVAVMPPLPNRPFGCKVTLDRPEKRPALVSPGTGNKKQKLSGQLENAILKAMADCRILNIHDPPKVLVSNLCNFQNPNSGRFSKAWRSVVQDGIVTNSSKKERVRLTNLGVDMIPEVKAPQNNNEVHHGLQKLAHALAKALKKTIPKLNVVWNKLADGQVHSEAEIASGAGYTNPNSAGIKNIIKVIKELGVVNDCKGKGLQFKEDIVFPFENPLVMHITI